MEFVPYIRSVIGGALRVVDGGETAENQALADMDASFRKLAGSFSELICTADSIRS
jgi:hypothetical protein